MTHYLVYWKPDTVASDEPWPFLMHSASNQYSKLRIGDVLWIVTSEEPDDLVLVGRQQVDKIVGQLEAEQLPGTPNLWAADYHVISNNPERKECFDISRWAGSLSFDGGVDALPEGFSGQHLQTMRRLDYRTANWFEKFGASETSHDRPMLGESVAAI